MNIMKFIEFLDSERPEAATPTLPVSEQALDQPQLASKRIFARQDTLEPSFSTKS